MPGIPKDHEKGIIKTAHEAYLRGDLPESLNLYKKAAQKYSQSAFRYNIARIEKELYRLELAASRALVLTNLNIQQIDGSTIFVANSIRALATIFEHVDLLTIHPPGKHFNLICAKNLVPRIVRISHESIRTTLIELERESKYSVILARLWRDSGDWLHTSYAHKVIYYWPLRSTFTNTDAQLYHKVGYIALQTAEHKAAAEQSLGEKNCVLLPPLIEYIPGEPKNHKAIANRKTRIAYTGTIRSECYGIEMLQTLLELLDSNPHLECTIAIGKIHFTNSTLLEKANSLIARLASKRRCEVHHQLSHKECMAILRNSDISLSLWKVNDQNNLQISTKLLECVASECTTICFQTDPHIRLFGADYKYFIRDISDLKSKLEMAISDALSDKEPANLSARKQIALAQFSLESQAIRICEAIGNYTKHAMSHLGSSFSADFDHIYGLHISEMERDAFTYLSQKWHIPIQPFQGVNAAISLRKEYQDYLNKPLISEWEIQNNKKRLSIGALGHLFSFMAIAKDAMARGYRKILVLESDAIFHKQFFARYFASRISKYKILYLGAGMWNQEIERQEGFYVPHKTTGTFAIALDRSILEECMAAWEKLTEPTDIALIPICEKYRSDCYVHFPNLVICDVASSLITSPRSQQALANQFRWNLEDYDIFYTKRIGAFVSALKIVVNYALATSKITIFLRDGGIVQEFPQETSTYTIDQYIIKIEFVDLFVSDIICQ